MLACGGVNVNINLAIAFYIKTAIADKNGVNSIWLLKRGLIETAKIVININRGAAI
jgi:hypothetical protein